MKNYPMRLNGFRETAEDEEKQNDSAEGSESEDTNQRNTADDDEDYTVTRKRKRSQKRLPQASFQCNFCGLTYGRRHHLQYHLRAHHLHREFNFLLSAAWTAYSISDSDSRRGGEK